VTIGRVDTTNGIVTERIITGGGLAAGVDVVKKRERSIGRVLGSQWCC
jgi:hypothetical protein